jgi:hypothetical protein
MPTENMRKTTVSFPISVLRGLRQYIAKHDLTSHQQSEVVARALREFLEADGIEIDSKNEALAVFEIEPKSGEI